VCCCLIGFFCVGAGQTCISATNNTYISDINYKGFTYVFDYKPQDRYGMQLLLYMDYW